MISARDHFQMIHKATAFAEISGKMIIASYGENPETGEGLLPKVAQFNLGDVDGMVKAVENFSKEKHRNIYLPLCSMVSKSGHPLKSTAKGAEVNIEKIFGLCCDFDDAEASKYLERLPLPPNYVLETSAGNYQTFYLFNQAYYFFNPALNFSEVKATAEALKGYTGCCPGTMDLSHVWRIPGLLNWPNKKKVDAGRSTEPQPVKIVKPWDGGFSSFERLKEVLKNGGKPAQEQKGFVELSDKHRFSR